MTENIVLANRLMDMASALSDGDGLNKSTKDMVYEAGGLILYLDRELRAAREYVIRLNALVRAAQEFSTKAKSGEYYGRERKAGIGCDCGWRLGA